jgi:hypothetical protein
MESRYIQQAKKYFQDYKQLKDKNPERAKIYKELAAKYMTLNREYEENERKKRLRQINPSNSDYLQQAKIHNQNYELFKDKDPELAEQQKQIETRYLEMHEQEEKNKQSEKDRNARLGQIFGIPSDSDVADEAAELGIDLDSQDDTNASVVDIPDNINDNETVSSTINPDFERLSDQDSSTSLPSYRSSFSLEDPTPSSRSFSSSTSLPSSRSTSTSSVTNSSSLPSSRSTSVSSLANRPLVVNLGFTESLRRHSRKIINNRVAKPNICKNIFMNGLNVNSQYFYPSEFPNLTKIKSVPIITKGGKRTRKNKSKKRKYKKNVKIN